MGGHFLGQSQCRDPEPGTGLAVARGCCWLRLLGHEGVAKCFHFYANPWHRALDWLRFQSKPRSTEIWALHNISFIIPRGRGLGVIGRNGSGKSTVLKILTGELKHTRGPIQSSGRILALLELDAGFSAGMIGRQSVLPSCPLLGFPAEYAELRMADIQSFAEISKYFDKPIETCSAGMFARLAFSAYLFFDPDILIVNEVLAVGRPDRTSTFLPENEIAFRACGASSSAIGAEPSAMIPCCFRSVAAPSS